VSGRFDDVVIGAGANGLVAAAVLARAGRKVAVLDRAAVSGGQSRLLEFAPGFRAAPLGLDAGWLPEPVARDAGIERPAPVTQDTPLSVAAGPGRFLTLSRDVARATEAIRTLSAPDAARWPAFIFDVSISACGSSGGGVGGAGGGVCTGFMIHSLS